jgi:sugar phosphate isomerase/epimerase
MPFSDFSLACCTLSVGAPDIHDLPTKLKAIAETGFDGIELGFPDLQQYSHHLHVNSHTDESPTSWASLGTAAENVKKLADRLGLRVVTLMPFGGYGGSFKDEGARNTELERAERWFELLDKLGGRILQVTFPRPHGLHLLTGDLGGQCGSNDDPSTSSDVARHADDLAALAQKGNRGIRPLRSLMSSGTGQ